MNRYRVRGRVSYVVDLDVVLLAQSPEEARAHAIEAARDVVAVNGRPLDAELEAVDDMLEGVFGPPVTDDT